MIRMIDRNYLDENLFARKYDAKVQRRKYPKDKLCVVETDFWKNRDKYLIFIFEMELMEWRVRIWENYALISNDGGNRNLHEGT